LLRPLWNFTGLVRKIKLSPVIGRRESHVVGWLEPEFPRGFFQFSHEAGHYSAELLDLSFLLWQNKENTYGVLDKNLSETKCIEKYCFHF
jgi:hypothetical protein